MKRAEKLSVSAVAAEFDVDPGYLATATCGVAPRSAAAALTADLARWSRGQVDAAAYDATVRSTRESYARLVGVHASRVAIGSQTSALVANVSAGLRPGAEVLVADGDFTSLIYPFLTVEGITVRSVPLDDLADAITDRTSLVAFSLVQSATGRVADSDSIARAAQSHDARTLVDLTQAAGVLPVDAAQFDITVCHAYKWLCSPRGVAFLTVREDVDDELLPLAAGWFAGQEPWSSCYGPLMELADDARRFDVSPAWQAFVGAEQSIGLFAAADLDRVWRHSVELGSALCRGLGIPDQQQAIVTWPDATGDDLARLTQAGVRASGRAGRLRAAFHVWNTEEDVDMVLAALRR